MGLAERRAVQNFKDQQFPELKRQLDAAAGFAVTVEVVWESLATEGNAHLYAECFPKVYFEPLIEACKSICIDQMGKDALKTGLKHVIVCNRTESSSGNAFTFTGGILTVDHLPTTNVDQVNDRRDVLVQLLEKGL